MTALRHFFDWLLAARAPALPFDAWAKRGDWERHHADSTKLARIDPSQDAAADKTVLRIPKKKGRG